MKWGDSSRGRGNFASELLYFFRTYKKWWLGPVFVFLAVFGLFVLAGGSQSIMAIYALF